MITLKAEVRDKDTVMIIYKDGVKVKRKGLGYLRKKTLKGVEPGTYTVVAKNGIWKSQHFEFNYDGETDVVLTAIAHPDYSLFQRLITSRDNYFKIIEE